MAAPSNEIPYGCVQITSQMLPLVALEPEHIERIVQTVPGGAGNIQDIYPLVPFQEGILFHHLLNQQGGDTYVLSTLLSVSSRERLDDLIEALQSVVDRHDILRSAVLWEQLPQPVQVVYRRAIVPVEEQVLEGNLDPIDQFKEQMTVERQRLDLRRAPLLRLRTAADPRSTQWFALLQLHHIVCDDQSLETIISEILSLLEGGTQALPDPLAYRNHVAQVLAHSRVHEAETFFRIKLGTIDEPTAPFGLLNVHGDGCRIEAAHQALDPALAQRLRAKARKLGLSVATLFHAAWGLVVSHTSGRDDVVFGTVLLGRLHANPESQLGVGPFINTLPLRLRLEGITAKELLEHTQRELVDLFDHEQAPLALVQKCSGISGSAPLFSALLNYRRRAPNSSARGDNAAGVRVLSTQGWTNYPVTLSVDDTSDEFVLTGQAASPIDPRSVVGYTQTALHSLVEALENAPQTSALSLSILPESERHRVSYTFNGTASPPPREKVVHEFFEEQVRRTPSAIAVVCEGQHLTYAELNGKANQLARHLRTYGIGPEQLVGICLERSIDMVIALLGTLKAGGAYVPLDPGYPPDRLRYMLADAAPRVILTQERLRIALPPTAAQVISLDRDGNAIAGQDAGDLASDDVIINSAHLAYVIYTSGSTGRPKGVAIEHRNTVNLLDWARSSFPNSALERTLFSTSLNFDLAVFECFAPLTVGGAVVLVRNILDLHHERTPVTLVNTVPSAMRALIDAGGLPETVRYVNLAGEVLDQTLVAQIFAKSDVASICNLYGPSETTTYSTWVEMSRQVGFTPSVGRPIANTQIYLLDKHRQPVPIGVTGEIYIGGSGIARGYLNEPELTAERFLRNPFSSDPHGRLYKTGDLGRWRPDGSIDYLGRNDHQVKIRGFRIELGEIETQLLRHTQVREAVVVAQEGLPGKKHLVAYVTCTDAGSAGKVQDFEKLRSHLKRVVPEYMIPGAFVILEQLPRTPNGKVDRQALPAPEQALPATDREVRTTQQYEGEVEKVLAEIWKEVLQVDRISREDNFFELGGQSLTGMKVSVRVAERFGAHLSALAVFEYPTIREMAELVASMLLQQPSESSDAEFETPTERPMRSDFTESGTTGSRAVNESAIVSGKEVIFVLGMARSGSSALTRVLSLCGCTLPESVYGAVDYNPKGLWESVDGTKLNLEFLLRHNGSDADPTMRLQRETVFEESEKEEFVNNIQAFLAKCTSGTALVIKCLGLEDLIDFWLEATRRNGYSAKFVIPIRHPQEVFASMAALAPHDTSLPMSGKVSVESVNTAWLKFNLLAERHSRNFPRVFVEYSNLVNDWRKEVARISKALSINLKADETAIDDFLSRDLRHQRYAGPINETFCYSWITRVYAALSAAAQDWPVDDATLSEIYHAYCTSARAFRISLDESQSNAMPQLVRQLLGGAPIWRPGRDF